MGMGPAGLIWFTHDVVLCMHMTYLSGNEKKLKYLSDRGVPCPKG